MMKNLKNWLLGEGNFDWKIWLKKVSLTVLAVVIVGGASVWANKPWFLLALPLLKALENWLKHR